MGQDWFTGLVIVIAEVCESPLILVAFSVTIMYLSKAGENYCNATSAERIGFVESPSKFYLLINLR